VAQLWLVLAGFGWLLGWLVLGKSAAETTKEGDKIYQEEEEGEAFPFHWNWLLDLVFHQL